MAIVEADGGERRRVLDAARGYLTQGIAGGPALLTQLADEAGVARDVVVQRWGSSESVFADLISQDLVGALDYPESDEPFATMTSREVLQTLYDGLSSTVAQASVADGFGRSGLGLVVSESLVRSVWQQFVVEGVDRWIGLVQSAEGKNNSGDVSAGTGAAGSAVRLMVSHCYAQLILGDLCNLDAPRDIVEIAEGLLTAPGGA